MYLSHAAEVLREWKRGERDLIKEISGHLVYQSSAKMIERDFFGVLLGMIILLDARSHAFLLPAQGRLGWKHPRGSYLDRSKHTLRLASSSAIEIEAPIGPSVPAAQTPYGQMSVGVPKETLSGESRVAQTPDSIKLLLKEGFREVLVEASAGASAQFTDEEYASAGARIVDRAMAWSASIIAKVQPPTLQEATLLQNRTIVSFIQPAQHADLMMQMQGQGSTAFAMDCIPRLVSRGQTYDALSSQANIAGYRAVIEAANSFGRFFSGQTTAAGKVAPAKVLVLGAGVAGLAAISTAKSMGAIVNAYDVRPAAREQGACCVLSLWVLSSF